MSNLPPSASNPDEKIIHRSVDTPQIRSFFHESWNSDLDIEQAKGKLAGTFKDKYQELKKQQTLHPNKAHRDKCFGEPLKVLNEERASQNLNSTATPQYSEVTLREGINVTPKKRATLEKKLEEYNETVKETNRALHGLSDSERTLLDFDISTNQSPADIIEMVKDVNTNWRSRYKVSFLEHAKDTHKGNKAKAPENSWGGIRKKNKAYYQEKIDAITALENKLSKYPLGELTQDEIKTAVEALILSEEDRQAFYLESLNEAKANRQKIQHELITLLGGAEQAAKSLTSHDTLDRTTDKSLLSRILGTHDKLIEHTHSGEVITMRYDHQDRTFKATTLKDNQGNPIILSNDEFRKARALFNQTQDKKDTPEMKLAEPVENGSGLWINCKPEQSAAFNEYIKGHLNQIKGRDLSVSGQVGRTPDARLDSTTPTPLSFS